MKLSIIIPAKNEASKIQKCILEVYKQTSSFFEVIVINGGGAKLDTTALQKKFKNLTIITEPDLGVYDAMNKGVLLAKGKWLYFMGVDDGFYNINVLKTLRSYFNNENVKLLLGNIVYSFNEKDSVFVKKNNGLVKSTWQNKIWIKNCLPHQGMFYHHSIFNQNLYDISYKVLGDYAFNLSLWKKKVSVVIIDEIVANCGTEGLSKQYNYSIYEEEIKLKTKASSRLFMPLFFILAMSKFILKKI